MMKTWTSILSCGCVLCGLASGEDISIPGFSCEQGIADAGFLVTEEGVCQALREGFRTSNLLLVMHVATCARSHGFHGVPKLMRQLLEQYEFTETIGNRKLWFVAEYLEFREKLQSEELMQYYSLAKENVFALDPSLRSGAYRVLALLGSLYEFDVCVEYKAIVSRPRDIPPMSQYSIYAFLRRNCAEQMSQSDFECIYLAWKNEAGERFEKFVGYLEEWANEDPRFEIPRGECPK